MRNLADIMDYLDEWVVQHGKYVKPDEVPDTASNSLKLGHIIKAHQLGIQQVREEIKDLIQVVLDKKLDGRVLEIGLGYYGGTHMLWRQIFKEVVTIEYSRPVIWKFKFRERVNSRSKVILGNSQKEETWKKVKEFGEFDMLFIDGDHTYMGITRDYNWYHGLVKTGGIIVFHDSICRVNGFGITEFLKDLAGGRIDDNRHNIKQIVHSDYVGIAYIEK